MNAVAMALRAFACRLRGETHETVIHATSPGRAKHEYLLDLDFAGVKYTDIRVRLLGRPINTDGIRRVAEYRGVPFARAGMEVIVGTSRGWIVGHNASANFDVEFFSGPYAGERVNCHPNSEIAYLADDGTILADFRRERAADPQSLAPNP